MTGLSRQRGAVAGPSVARPAPVGENDHVDPVDPTTPTTTTADLLPSADGAGHPYRSTLQSVVAAAVAPYGYTLSVWSSGAILVGAAGIPSTAEVLMLIAGATAAFLCLTAVAFGGFARGFASVPALAGPVWAVAHVPAIGLTALFVALLARITQSTALWPVAGFGTTATYLSVVAAQFALATRMARVPVARPERSTSSTR